jgi:hypothetical protein
MEAESGVLQVHAKECQEFQGIHQKYEDARKNSSLGISKRE